MKTITPETAEHWRAGLRAALRIPECPNALEITDAFIAINCHSPIADKRVTRALANAANLGKLDEASPEDRALVLHIIGTIHRT